MINLNKQRIAVYIYFFVVFTLIFSLSFAVQGNKITGSVVFDTAGNIFNNVGNFAENFTGIFTDKINLLHLNFTIIAILSFLAFTLFIVKYFYNKEFNSKLFVGFIIILFVFGVLFFGFNIGNDKNKITGYQTVANGDEDFLDSVSDAFSDFYDFLFGPSDWEVVYDGKTYIIDATGRKAEVTLDKKEITDFRRLIVLNKGNYFLPAGEVTSGGSSWPLKVDRLTGAVYAKSPNTGDLYLFNKNMEDSVDTPVGGPTLYADARSQFDGKDPEIYAQIESSYIQLFPDNEGNLFVKKEGQFFSINSKTYEIEGEAIADEVKIAQLELESYAHSIIASEINYLMHNILNLALGSTVDESLRQFCEAKSDSSVSSSGKPYTINPSTFPADLGEIPDPNDECKSSQLTIVSAQGRKRQQESYITYETSYTINPCKQSITYTVYMANSVDDRIGLESGAANKAKLISNSKHFTYPINYSSICIQVSDATIGDNGYSCFDIV